LVIGVVPWSYGVIAVTYSNLNGGKCMNTGGRTQCVEPVGKPASQESGEQSESATLQMSEEEQKMVARVGYEAPDFEAKAFIDGDFKNLKLSDFKGEWVMLCFYPGDFTFV
jgi:hypothetical protein